MRATSEELAEDIYNLILNPATREWERARLLAAKNAALNERLFKHRLAQLEADLRPLALRNNLTPDVSDFYLKMINDPAGEREFELPELSASDAGYQERAIFAGGCFWCMVEPFETQPGIISVLSGYTGGNVEQPVYDQVAGGYTGHVEAVEIIFDTRLVSYAKLVELYWQLTDPTDGFGQFQDRGDQYRPVIFVQDNSQRRIAEKSKQRLKDSGKYKHPIVTKIEAAQPFWPAENYHQQFYKKQPKRYRRIKQERQQFLIYQHLKSCLRMKRSKQ